MDKKEIKKRIKEGATKGQVLRITYKDSKGDVSKRNVEPYEIKNNHLWAYCRKRRNIRQFKLGNISHVTITKYNYMPKWPVKIGNDTLKKTASVSYEKWLYKIGNAAFGSYEEAEVD